MAKPKQDVMVIKHTFMIQVYVNDTPKWVNDVTSIEGVSSVFVEGKTRLDVFTDPRYDMAELAQEIEDLLKVDVPDVFKAD